MVHAHTDNEAAGATLRMAALARIPIRIAHIHSAPTKAKKRLRSYVYRIITDYWMRKYMTRGSVARKWPVLIFSGGVGHQTAGALFCTMGWTGKAFENRQT